MKKTKIRFTVALCLLLTFAVWTAAVCFADKQAIGPNESIVGLATMNQFIHQLTGVHMWLYVITDWLGLIPFGAAAGFGILGLVQWIQRKNLLKVDYSILVLGGFYMVVIAFYFLFEIVVVNHRPILIEGILEASYPSSTTMLALCVMSTAIMQLSERIKNLVFKRCVIATITAFTLFMVIGRLISGVHWFSDIVGGTLLSAGLVMLYHAIANYTTKAGA